MQIQFLGAADTVTGSRHLVTLGGQRILLDCGLFQGYKVLRERNWQPLGALPRDIDAVVLSHAHLDHSGWLPGLVKAGFKGPIYASPATRDLAEVLLLDSAHLQEEDARRANRYGYSRHEKALPLYTKADAKRAIARIQAVPPGRALKVGDVAVQMTPVGHLLGACSVRLAHRNESLAFSGDVGRSHDLLMPPPQPLPAADVLLVESTYGNRLHHRGRARRAGPDHPRDRQPRRQGAAALVRGGPRPGPAAGAAAPEGRRRDPRPAADLPGQPDGHRGHGATPATAACCACRSARSPA